MSRARAAGALGLTALAMLAAVGIAAAATSRGERSGEASAGAVFSRLAGAFEAGNASDLAALVHSEGLRVTGHNDRASEYSPSQAVYFFKNLFQSHRTLVFAFRRTQDDAAGGHARGLADWKRRRVDSERVIELQLLLVLAQDGGQWRLTEINMIR